MKKIKLSVIFYGDKKQMPANERQFKDLSNILKNFQVKKYNFNNVGQSKLLADFKEGRVDIVLKNSYGRGHENKVESFLELHKIPFMGSDSKSTFIGTSKFLSKIIFREHGINVAGDIFIDRRIWKNGRKKILNAMEKIDFPCLIKDTGGVDSRGIYFIQSKKKFLESLPGILEAHENVIAEKYISDSLEVICMAVGNEKPVAYEPVIMNKKNGKILFGKEKDKMLIEFKIPCGLNNKLIGKIKDIAVRAHQALGCKTFSRSDILIKNGSPFLLEVDVHPGFRANSPTFLSARYTGISPNELFLKFYKLSNS